MIRRPLAFGRRRAAALLAILFLAGHLPFLPSSLEDIDSTNFALGLRDFDVAGHQPHPPGYPVFMALGRTALALVEGGTADSPVDGGAREAVALALCAIFAGALAAFPLLRFFRSLELSDRSALAATMLTLGSPLFWFTAGRPMSDVPGLAAAFVPLALIGMCLERLRSAQAGAGGSADGSPIVSRRDGAFDRTDWLAIGASVAAGVSIGVRVQNAWVTLPLLVLALVWLLREKRVRGVAVAVCGFAAGVLLWLVPLLVASGSAARYFQALTTQGVQDWTDVDLLARDVSSRRLVLALLNTFLAPWAHPALGLVVLMLGVIGAGIMSVRSRFALTVLALVMLPYALIHLFFQEVVTTRYALPIIPVLAYLAVRGAEAVWSRAAPFAAVALTAASLAVAAPSAALYARDGSPVVRAARDLKRFAAQENSPPAVLAMHHAFSVALRGERLPLERLPSPRIHESLTLPKYWLSGGHRPVWFLADPRRTDLAVVDPASRRLRQSYRWAFPSERFMSGIRPNEVDWYVIDSPGWFVGDGWSLTPELAGITERDRSGLGRGAIRAYIRRRDGEAVMLVGGRHLGAPGSPPARVSLLLDGQPLSQWTVAASEAFFLQRLAIPSGRLSGRGRYAELTINTEALDNSGTPPVAIEQFDLQPIDSVVYGFAAGWHEQEYDPRTGRTWRWSSDRSHLLVHHGGRDVQLRLMAEDPLIYNDRPPRVVVRSGRTVLADLRPSGDMAFTVDVAASVLDLAAGQITLETDNTFVPADRSPRTGDRRRLGLRCFGVSVVPAGAPRTAASSPAAYPSSAAAAIPARATRPAQH